MTYPLLETLFQELLAMYVVVCVQLGNVLYERSHVHELKLLSLRKKCKWSA